MQSGEGIRRLDRRLDADQESVVDQTFAGSQTAGSDYGYAMKQWLLRAETVFDDIISNSTGVTDGGPGQPESPEIGTTSKRGFYRMEYTIGLLAQMTRRRNLPPKG